MKWERTLCRTTCSGSDDSTNRKLNVPSAVRVQPLECTAELWVGVCVGERGGDVGERLVDGDACPARGTAIGAVGNHAPAAPRVAERLRAANVWKDHDLVFATEIGTPVDPRNALRMNSRRRSREIDGVGVHTLRHSAAVAWLEGGTHIKAAAVLLGHSSIAITGDVYGHNSDDTARSAVDALADQFGILDL